MSSTPVVAQAPILGIANLNNASGTASQTIYAAGANGAQLESLNVMSGPTTAPGGAYVAVIELYDGVSKTGMLFPITLQNLVDTNQFNGQLGFNLAPLAEIKIRMRTTLAAGATIDAVITGRSY